jgi:hypothetical protein
MGIRRGPFTGTPKRVPVKKKGADTFLGELRFAREAAWHKARRGPWRLDRVRVGVSPGLAIGSAQQAGRFVVADDHPLQGIVG